MNTCPEFTHLLVLPHLRVQNANAVSSPLTHGFPSVTAFLGLMWALERRLHSEGLDINLVAIGAVCHGYDEQVTTGGFVKTFRLTRNPIGKDGNTAAIVEEGRIHLELSVAIAIRSANWTRNPEICDSECALIADQMASMRIAGGSVKPPADPWRHRYKPWRLDLTGNDESRALLFRKARMRLLPGFSLVARDDVIDLRRSKLQLTNPKATRLDAWLSLSRTNWHYQAAADDKTSGEWQHDREHGWIVPIPVGYGALGNLHAAGTVANARDATTPFRFVESLYSIGQWVSPHRIEAPQQMLWYADSNPDSDCYRCRNDFVLTSDPSEQRHDFDFDLD